MEYMENGMIISYDDVGCGMPVLMLHGFTVDRALMAGCMEPVFANRPGYRRIYPDLPGMGMSKAPTSFNSSDGMLDAVVRLVDAVIPNERFLVAGESYGGYLARGLAARMKDKLDGMLLICPMIIAQRERRTLPAQAVIQKNAALAAQYAAEEFDNLDEMLVIQTGRTYARMKAEVLSGIRLADKEFTSDLQAHRYAFSFDVDGQSPMFSKPALFLLGRQDSIVGYSDAWKLLEKYPRATFAVLDSAGHNLQIEQESLFNALVSEWLDRVAYAQSNP